MQLRGRRLPMALLALPPVLLAIAAAWIVMVRPGRDPDAVWREGEDEMRRGDFARAEQAVATLSRLRRPTPLDWMLRAQVAMARDRPDEALADLAHLPDDDPHAAQARLLAGQLELRRLRARPAEAFLLEALRLDPGLIQARRELVYIYGVQSRRRELGEQFRALSAQTPLTFDNVFHWCLSRNVVWEPLETMETMRRFLAADPDDRWSRLALAESLRQLSRFDDAERVLAVLPASDPDARAARVRLALARGDDRGAAALLAEGPADHADLARLRGRMALARRDPGTALEHFRAAHRAEPGNRDTLFGLAGALTMLGQAEAARPFLAEARGQDVLETLIQRAITGRSRQDPKLLRELGAACEAIHRLAEARAWYNLAIALDPLDVQSQQALFRLNAALADTKKAGAGT